ADDPRANLLGEAGPDDEDLSCLVVRRLLAGVAALGQYDRLPFPLEDGRVLEMHLALDLAVDGRAVVGALHVERAAAVIVNDLEVLVVRRAPILCFPLAGQAYRADLVCFPVLRSEVRRVGDGGERGECELDYKETREHGA